MNRIWNLQAKIVALIVFLLVGSFVLQSAVDHFSKQKLLVAVTGVAEDLTDEVFQKMMQSLVPNSTTPPASLTVTTGSHSVVRIIGAGQRHKHRDNAGTQLEIRVDLAKQQLENFVSNKLEEGRGIVDSERRAETIIRELERFPQTLATPFDAFQFVPNNSNGVPVSPPIFVGGPDSEFIDLAPYTERLERIFRDFRRFDMLSALGILLLGISLAWFLGVRITRPMTELSEAFQQVASGDLQHRVHVESRGEFALLTEQFNRMAEALVQNQELERELVLRERIQHMGDLAAGVAHDIRNPLNAIFLNIGQIRDEFLPANEQKQERFLRFTSDVQKEVERLNELVTNYLSLAQPASTDSERVSPNELVEEVGRLLQKEAAARRVALNLDLEESLPLLDWNRLELKSAFLNVAINALQSMEPDGGRLDIVTGIREGQDGTVDSVAVTFNDTGCGIPEENLQKVFVPYFTTRNGGTGLGMAVARRIAERHGGRMQVSSREGEGSSISFLFSLPSAGASSGDSTDGGGVA